MSSTHETLGQVGHVVTPSAPAKTPVGTHPGRAAAATARDPRSALRMQGLIGNGGVGALLRALDRTADASASTRDTSDRIQREVDVGGEIDLFGLHAGGHLSWGEDGFSLGGSAGIGDSSLGGEFANGPDGTSATGSVSSGTAVATGAYHHDDQATTVSGVATSSLGALSADYSSGPGGIAASGTLESDAVSGDLRVADSGEAFSASGGIHGPDGVGAAGTYTTNGAGTAVSGEVHGRDGIGAAGSYAKSAAGTSVTGSVHAGEIVVAGGVAKGADGTAATGTFHGRDGVGVAGSYAKGGDGTTVSGEVHGPGGVNAAGSYAKGADGTTVSGEVHDRDGVGVAGSFSRGGAGTAVSGEVHGRDGVGATGTYTKSGAGTAARGEVHGRDGVGVAGSYSRGAEGTAVRGEVHGPGGVKAAGSYSSGGDGTAVDGEIEGPGGVKASAGIGTGGAGNPKLPPAPLSPAAPKTGGTGASGATGGVAPVQTPAGGAGAGTASDRPRGGSGSRGPTAGSASRSNGTSSGAGGRAGTAAGGAGQAAGGRNADAVGSASINEELAEHQRWAQSSATVGATGSDERAAFLAESAGRGLIAGSLDGLGQGLEIGLGVMLLEHCFPIPGLGLIVGGAMALHGIIENWDTTTATLGHMGEGADIYERMANDLAGIATMIDLVAQILNVIGGIAGAISLAMWIITVLTVGVATPLALTISAITGLVLLGVAAGNALAQSVLQPTIAMFRALHAFQSEADPRSIEAQGAQITSATQIMGGQLGGMLATGMLMGLSHATTEPAPRPGATPELPPGPRSSEPPQVVIEAPAAIEAPAGPAPAEPLPGSRNPVQQLTAVDPALASPGAPEPPGFRSGPVDSFEVALGGDITVDPHSPTLVGEPPSTRPGSPGPEPLPAPEAVEIFPGEHGNNQANVSWNPDTNASVSAHGGTPEAGPGGWYINDVVRGSNPEGSGAGMVVEAGRASGVERPNYVLGEVGNEGTLARARAGESPEGSTLGNMRGRVAERVGGRAGPSTWADANGRPISPQEAQALVQSGEPVYLRTDITYPPESHSGPGVGGGSGAAVDAATVPMPAVDASTVPMPAANASTVPMPAAKAVPAPGPAPSSPSGEGPKSAALPGTPTVGMLPDPGPKDESMVYGRTAGGITAAAMQGAMKGARATTVAALLGGGPGMIVAGAVMGGMRESVAAAGRAPGVNIDPATGKGIEMVNPKYRNPPGTPQQIAAINSEIAALEVERANIAMARAKATSQQAEHQAFQSGIQKAQDATKKAQSGAQKHQEEAGAKQAKNQEAQGKQKEATAKIATYPEKAAGIATLRTPLAGFKTFTHYAAMLPGDVGAQFHKMNAEAIKFDAALERASIKMAEQALQGPMRLAGWLADEQRLIGAKAGSVAAQSQFEQQHQTASKLAEANTKAVAQRGKTASDAQKHYDHTSDSIDKRQAKASTLAAQLDSWAQEHKQARLDALGTTKAKYEARGYRVTVKGE